MKSYYRGFCKVPILFMSRFLLLLCTSLAGVAWHGGVYAAATHCVDGMAGPYPCSNVDLLSRVAVRSPGAADIWGFMDLNTHREYVIVGYSAGTAVFDVTDAGNPREVGFVAGQATLWRDIKVLQFWNATDRRWNAVAYVTADNAADGLVVIDLSQLPHRIARIPYAGDFAAAHNVYLTDTEFSTGIPLTADAPLLILAGSDRSDGRFRSYSLENPASPAFVATPATPADQAASDRLYMHDAASMVVTDDRKNTQCVNAGNADHCDVLFDFNGQTFDIWDLTIPANPVRLSQTTYANVGYIHSGWWSEDQQYLFVQDEIDERDSGLNTTLRVFSISDLTLPTLVGAWTGSTTAIDHNGFVRGNRYYLSNYTRGLTILDISSAGSPVMAGRFDSFPSSDAMGFDGNWGVYPFLPSGNIAISDRQNGMFMLVDNTRAGAQGSLSFTASAFGGDEIQSTGIVVQRTGGSQGVTTVNWDVVAATGSFDDVVLTKGSLSWSDGDATNRIIDLAPSNDGRPEGLERILIRLSAPTGGASLSSPDIASYYISDPGDTPVVEFSTASISIEEFGFATAIAVVRRLGSAIGAVSVDFSVSAGDASSDTDYTGPSSGTINWDDGDADPRWIEYAITDDGGGEANEFFELSLSNATGAVIGARSQLRINILDDTLPGPMPSAGRGGGGSLAFWLLGGLLGFSLVRGAVRKDAG